MSLVVLIPLGVAYAVAVRVATGHFAWYAVERWYTQQKHPDACDWTFSFVAALAWPAVLALWAVCKALAVGCRWVPPIGAEARHRESQRLRAHRKRAGDLGVPES